ncbi:MAG: methylmalonyl-CoA mutase [Deltaproteobacteria bacterium]|nr:methylmalonyl-CoA mutase [Deltaproteobacteria bacterium]
MSKKRVRILMTKFGEGYEEALLKLSRAFSEAGFEVIYTTMNDPEAIVIAAAQESVDHIGVTTLPGSKIEDFARLLQLLAAKDLSHVRVSAGGFLEDQDIPRIKEMGVVEFFPKGTTFAELIQWSKEHIKHAD